MKLLVTGGAGFIGSHLVDALVGQCHQVIVLDNLRRSSTESLHRHLTANKVTLLTEDIRDYDSVLRAADGTEVVYHLAAQSNIMGALHDPDYSFTTNVVGTFNVLKAASRVGARRVVFTSSREVYGEPESVPVPESAPLKAKNPYGASKVAAEAYCRAWRSTSELECQVLRLANVYGPRDRDRVIPVWLGRALRGEDLELYGGEQVLDFVWVGRVLEALLAAARCPDQGPVNVGSGTGTRLPDLARRIVQLTGSRSSVWRLPARGAEVIRFVADAGKMRCLLGVTPDDDPLVHLKAMIAGETSPLTITSDKRC